jgi:hypothetical protein
MGKGSTKPPHMCKRDDEFSHELLLFGVKNAEHGKLVSPENGMECPKKWGVTKGRKSDRPPVDLERKLDFLFIKFTKSYDL